MTIENTQNLKLAEKGAKLSIITYIILASFKIFVGQSFNSDALFADGLNNFTDIIASVAVLIGLKLAQKPADHNHPYGHWKAETIASFITAFIMVLISLQVLIENIPKFFQPVSSNPDWITAVVALISGLVMLAVSSYNNRLASEANSLGIKATAKDNFSDALTSLSTFVAIVFSRLGFPWVDGVMAVIVGFIILKTGVEIFMESSFLLSDGFEEKTLIEYREAISEIKGIYEVRDIRARLLGGLTYVDVTIAVNPELSVVRSHYLTEKVEKCLFIKFGVSYCDVHVEPFHSDGTDPKTIQKRLEEDQFLN